MRVVRELSAKGITVLFVSHRLDEVLEIANRVTVLRDGRVVGVYDASELDLQILPKLMTGKEIAPTGSRRIPFPKRCFSRCAACPRCRITRILVSRWPEGKSWA